MRRDKKRICRLIQKFSLRFRSQTGRSYLFSGNLLDNALEACEQIKGKERWIRIKNKKKNQLIYIEIANAIAKKPDQNGSGFISTKKENGLHGYGMRNIRDIVEKYEGIFQYEIRDGR
mgnify:CR=1 FL=1